MTRRDAMDILPELKRTVRNSERMHQIMLERWTKLSAILVFISVAIVVAYLGLYPETVFNTSEIAKTIIGPSLTANALFISFVPTIGFFHLREIKELQEKSILLEEAKPTKPELVELVDLHKKLHQDFWHNVGSGMRKYENLSIVCYLLVIFVVISLHFS